MVLGWQAVIGTATNLRSADGSIFTRSPHKICMSLVSLCARGRFPNAPNREPRAPTRRWGSYALDLYGVSL